MFDDAFMLLHLFYCVVWFCFYLIWFQNPFLKWLWKTNLYKKRKKNKTYLLPVQPVAWRPARACFLLLSRSWATEPSPEFPPFLSCPRGPAQEAVAAHLPSFVSLTQGPTGQRRPPRVVVESDAAGAIESQKTWDFFTFSVHPHPI
jgi:hypothetical protein